MKAPRTVAAVVLLVTAPAATGCHRYVPVEADQPRPDPGQQVRAYLNEPDRVRLTHITAENVIQINGEMVEWGNGRVVMSAFWLKSGAGVEHRAVGETVVVQESSIGVLEAKQPSVAASVALTGALVVAAIIVGRAFAAGASEGDPPGLPPPPTTRRGGHN
jgi:hypothetical protein